MTNRKNVRACHLLFRWKEGMACFTTTFENKKRITVCTVLLNSYIDVCVAL
jgi:hypothetical protein